MLAPLRSEAWRIEGPGERAAYVMGGEVLLTDAGMGPAEAAPRKLSNGRRYPRGDQLGAGVSIQWRGWRPAKHRAMNLGPVETGPARRILMRSTSSAARTPRGQGGPTACITRPSSVKSAEKGGLASTAIGFDPAGKLIKGSGRQLACTASPRAPALSQPCASSHRPLGFPYHRSPGRTIVRADPARAQVGRRDHQRRWLGNPLPPTTLEPQPKPPSSTNRPSDVSTAFPALLGDPVRARSFSGRTLRAVGSAVRPHAYVPFLLLVNYLIATMLEIGHCPHLHHY